MSVLSDRDIKKWIGEGGLEISPLQPHSFQPASVELHLGSDFRTMGYSTTIYDLSDKVSADSIRYQPWSGDFFISPGQFALAHTLETVKLPKGLVARVEGKSSLGRFGLAIHVTAGFIDPGFEGQITLELVNHSPYTYRLRPGMKIAQLCIMTLHGDPSGLYGDAKYGSHYQGQKGATVAKSV